MPASAQAIAGMTWLLYHPRKKNLSSCGFMEKL